MSTSAHNNEETVERAPDLRDERVEEVLKDSNNDVAQYRAQVCRFALRARYARYQLSFLSGTCECSASFKAECKAELAIPEPEGE